MTRLAIKIAVFIFIVFLPLIFMAGITYWGHA